jgi:peptidyl-prolyl cis-trans isomerase SurA
MAQQGGIPAEELERVRQQVLRNLIDETLQIQAAKVEKIEIRKSDIDRTVARVASSVKRTPEQLEEYLTSNGTSMTTLRRQIEGEIAWQRLQRAKIESGVSVGDDEVKAVLDRMTSAKGSEEYRVGEIFISATPANQAEAFANATRILDQLKSGASFAGYARQFSEASTAAVGGDLGWVRPEQLPTPLAAALRQMTPGSISNPIPVPGGLSIIAVQDTRKILTADPRDAVLNLKQVSISFPAGTSRQLAEPVVARFADAARNVGGCGGADKLAADFRGELVMCGRDETDPSEPTFDQVYNQLNEERVNMRSRRYLRDLRRDAVIEFR